MNSMSKYVVLKKGLSGLPSLVKPSEVMDVIEKDPKGINSDWYQSIHYYNDSHVQLLKEKGSLRGVTDVKTDKLVFDFDDAGKPENAKKDAQELCQRLIKEGVKESNIEAYYSGNKGFHVIITLNKELTPRQAQLAATKFATGLVTFDTTLFDAAQILRVPWTLNKEHYKIPLTVKQLESPMAKIKYMAKDINNVEGEFHWDKTDINEEYFKEPPVVVKAATTTPAINSQFATKPRHWPDYKWALLNAVQVKESERHEALMVIAATCKGLGYPEEMTRALCLTFDEKFIQNTKKPPVEDLDDNILFTVYSDKWNGGMFSIKNNIWLQNYAKRVGIDVDKNSEEPTISIDSAFDMFKDYATNIDSLTIKTGIRPLDEKARMTIGMTVGIVAGPGVGKTSLSLQILNSMSNTNEQSIFFSFDMYHALVFQKLVQKHLRVTDDEIFSKFKSNDQGFQKKVVETLKKEYANVDFCFKTGMTPDDIERTIKHTEEKTGKKLRLAVVDYSELVLTDFSDMTAGSAAVAQKLREIATKLNICIVVLLQPNKMAGTPADELKSYRNLKGSSSAEQALSIILGMSRPGYDPRHPENDQFITIKCLKNRMGGLFTLDLGWAGATGDIYELNEHQEAHLEEIRKKKSEDEAKDKTENGGWN